MAAPKVPEEARPVAVKMVPAVPVAAPRLVQSAVPTSLITYCVPLTKPLAGTTLPAAGAVPLIVFPAAPKFST